MNSMKLDLEIPVTTEYDVIVFGAGSAGCIAAIQAGREGARTALIEKNGILGGTAVVASVNFPGLFHAWGKQVIAGIGWEVIEETVRRGGAKLPDFSYKPGPLRHAEQQILVNRFVFSTVLDEFCMKANVHVRFHEMPAMIQMGDSYHHVVVAGKTGLEILRAKKLVDATGDANVAGMLGLPRVRNDHLQPGTLIYQIDGYEIANIKEQELEECYQKSLVAGEILPTDHHGFGSPPFWRELRSGGGNCMHITGVDGSSSSSKTEAELKARASLMRIYQFLRKVPGCESLQVSYFANECGIRETWRISGESEVDVLSYSTGYVWEDAICYSFYPIDIHSHQGNTIDIRQLSFGIVPTIPYFALIPQGSEHLLAAGRCIAGDDEASSAYRVQATCMATGQAAGAAAAIAAKHNCSVKEVNIDSLRDVLKRNGAIIPI